MMYLDSGCSCGGKYLDKMLQPGILLCVRGGKKFGYQIIEELGRNPMFDGISPDKTGVYRYLKRMERAGYLAVSFEMDTVGDAPRKCYAISDKGFACLGSWADTLREYTFSLSRLVEEIEGEQAVSAENSGKPTGRVKPLTQGERRIEMMGQEESGKEPLAQEESRIEPMTQEKSSKEPMTQEKNGTDQAFQGAYQEEPEKEEETGRKEESKTDLYLITGFLGAGKSTFLKHFLGLFKGKKIQLIINEFGAEDVDGVLLGNLGVELEEITGGSVFCSCRIDQFEKALSTFVEEDTDVVIVEASGLSDPTGVRNLLYESERFPHICYRGSICLVDAVRFPKIYAKSRTCVKQIAAADLALINKIDKASEETLEQTRAMIRDQRPDLTVYETSFGRTDEDLLAALSSAKTDSDAEMPLTADLTTRKMAVQIRDGVSIADLEHFLIMFVETTFRVKGFVRTDLGLCLVSCVGNLISIEPYGAEVPEDRIGILVILSGAGMPVKKTLKTAVSWYQNDVTMLK